MSRIVYFLKMILFASIIVSLILLSLYTIHQNQRAKLRETEREIVQAEIKDKIVQYHNGETQTIDLSQISSFTWDRLYIFGPNIRTKNIQQVLGSPWRSDSTYAPPRPYTYLVFTLDEEVVQYVEYPISEVANFSGAVDKIEGYTPEDARFVINRHGYVVWFYE